MHALDRLAYGPTPGEADSLARTGVMRWIDRQLDEKGDDSRALADRSRDFAGLDVSRQDLARRYAEAQRERRLLKQSMADSVGPAAEPMRPGLGARRQGAAPGPMREFRELAGDLAQWTVVRATFADHQLAEIMTDFWLNHFNVYLNKGADRYLVPSYVEQTIRPRALGRFEDLLLAVAHSPAMLFYLDNAESVAPGSEPPEARRRLRFGYDAAAGQRQPAPDRHQRELRPRAARAAHARRGRRLHPGRRRSPSRGCSRAGASSVPTGAAAFVFRDWAHDRGAKTVLGVAFPAGHGEDEGERLLRMLAREPATMHHVSAKLCARFVSDQPSDECIDEAVAAWKRSRGDMREVLRAIFRSARVLEPDRRRGEGQDAARVRGERRARGGRRPRLDPAPRAAGGPARPAALPPGLAGRLPRDPGRLGEQRRPAQPHDLRDGARRRATARASRTNLDAIVPATGDYNALVEAVNQRCLSGRMTEHTRQVIRKELADVGDPVEARALAVGLALGGPEFQRQ